MPQSAQFMLAMQPLQQQLASKLYEIAQQVGNLKGGGWEDICLDVCGGDDSHKTKVIMTTKDGKKSTCLVSKQVDPLVEQIWDLRKTLSGNDVFYGLKLSITNDGKCNVDFDYNPVSEKATGGFFAKLFGKG